MESSKTASAEWLNGAVAGSASGGQAPSMMNAPGTCSSTNEKSSDPVTGNGVGEEPALAEGLADRPLGEGQLGRRR